MFNAITTIIYNNISPKTSYICSGMEKEGAGSSLIFLILQ